jgi:hypothetical protein
MDDSSQQQQHLGRRREKANVHHLAVGGRRSLPLNCFRSAQQGFSIFADVALVLFLVYSSPTSKDCLCLCCVSWYFDEFWNV